MSDSSGWFSYSPSDPASFDELTADQKVQVARPRPPKAVEPAAWVHVALESLSPGQSVVELDTGVFSHRDVLEAAIAELTAAREVFGS
jgi:hypothetical protein